VCQVNVPGFPIARARVASGQVLALVAAGAYSLARLKANPVEDLQARVDRLETKEKEALLAAATEAKSRFEALRPMVQATEEPDAVVADGIYQEVEPHLVAVLEQLLADTIAFSFRAQGYHWNVKGSNFPQYHEMFGEVYEDSFGSVDPLAENILKLGYDAPFDITTFAAMSPLGTSQVESNSCQAMAYDLYTASEYLVAQYKNAFAVADAANEQGVADFLAGRIDNQQKWSWQLRVSSVPEGMGHMDDDNSDADPYAMVFSAVQELPEMDGIVASAGAPREDMVAEFAAMLEFATFTKAQRDELAKAGKALRDGSYPIRNKADLKNAIRAIGRANKAKRAAVKRHILKRAKALGATKLIPESWAVTASAEDLRSRIAEFAAEVEELKKAQTES
jgi:starvation-inducible DNA-binding protein